MQTLTLKAPAKINLYLNVLGKRPDGYHNIETIFEKLDLCDKVTLKKRKRGIKVLCPHKDVPEDKRNLTVRAAQAVLAETNRDDGVEISIAKRIPVAAGLGGGSSDAASVLLGLNKLLSLSLTRNQLLGLAQKLGADVPFFILPNFRAIGRGKGELLAPLRLKRRNWYVLVLPKGLMVSTSRMYRALKLTLTKRPSSVKITLRALEEGDLTALNKYGYNSFEPLLIKKYKEIGRIKKALKSLGAKARLISGSGPCVFGICASRKEAMDIKEKLRAQEKSWRVIVAKTYSNSKKGGLRRNGNHRGKNLFTRQSSQQTQGICHDYP